MEHIFLISRTKYMCIKFAKNLEYLCTVMLFFFGSADISMQYDLYVLPSSADNSNTALLRNCLKG